MRIRSIDGTVYGIVSSPADYILHPVFLKFVIAACLLYGLLDHNSKLAQLTGWLIWGQVIVVTLLWLVFSGGIVRWLFLRGTIRYVWTPILLLPMLMLLEAMVQVMYFFLGLPPKPWGMTLSDMARIMAVILLFDFLHGQYVVACHPHARVHSASSTTTAAPPIQPLPNQPLSNQPSSSLVPSALVPSPLAAHTPGDQTGTARPALFAPPKASSPDSVRIGADSFVLSDILMIRIEDHYLNIITRSGHALQRAKLAAIAQLHNGHLGIQINRSVWVAFWAIRDVQSARNGQMLLVLINGKEELVAKPRLHAFRQAYRMATSQTT